jgi:hypothetical protein
MAMEELKAIMTHMAEMQRQALEANKDTVVSLLGGLNTQFQTQRLQDQANAKVLMDELKESKQHKPRQGFTDMKFMLNLESYSGVKEDFYDWARHLKSFMTKYPDALDLLLTAERSSAKCTHEDIIDSKGQEGVDTDKEIYNYLIAKTKGEAGTIVSQGQGCGCEAWRLLALRYDPKSAETKRALMKKITIPKISKTITELDKNIMDWEYNIRRYEEASDKPMDQDHKVCTIIEMCPHNLKEHLDLNVKEDTGYEEVRKLIVRYIDLHRDRGGVMPMDVGNLHTKDSEYYDYIQEYTSEHIDAVAPGTICHRCNGVGHMASQCATPKGEGKGGMDMKGKGKGWYDNKGKGKGWHDHKGKGKGWYTSPYTKGQEKGDHKGNEKGKGKGKSINGACNSCGVWGHMARDCWQGKGAVHGVDDTQNEYFEPYPTDVSCIGSGFSMCSIDAETWSEVKTIKDIKKEKRVWKTLDMNGEITMHNRYGALQDIDEKITTMEIMTVSAQEKPKKDKMRAIGKGRITIDSGAAESVIPKDMLKEYVTTKESKMKDTVYTSADGGRMWNYGCKQLHFRSPGEEDVNTAEFQCTTVTKPLASVARIAAKGNRVVFEEDGGYIENKTSGKRIAIIKDRGTYAIEVEYMISDPSEEDNESGFTRQW